VDLVNLVTPGVNNNVAKISIGSNIEGNKIIKKIRKGFKKIN
jgi:hypothetical protein